MLTANAGRLDVDSAVYAAVCRWLYDEAALLDHNRFDEWLALLAPDVSYVMPVPKPRCELTYSRLPLGENAGPASSERSCPITEEQPCPCALCGLCGESI